MPLSKHTTLIIAVAAASVAAVLAVLVLYRVLRRPPKQVPLPPKQELARYREQHIHDPESRPPTWYNSASLSAPPSEAYAASRSSLIPGDSRGGSPFRHSSLNISESPSDDVFSSAPMPLPLQLPHLPFDTSSTSLSTSETDSPPSSSPRLASDSPFSHTQSSRHPRSASASSRPHPRARPLSVGSSTSRNSRAIRGVPHGPHSQVQIVLPAPLAFTDVSENSLRLSVVDQWAPMAVRSEGNPVPRSQRRSFSNSEPRRSTSQASLSPPPINAPHARRATSASLSASLPQRSPPRTPDYSNLSSRLSPPPVPQIPQQWLPDPLMGIPEDSGRGRSRDVAPSAVTSERPPQPVDRPPPSDKRKLQKRSRSRT